MPTRHSKVRLLAMQCGGHVVALHDIQHVAEHAAEAALSWDPHFSLGCRMLHRSHSLSELLGAGFDALDSNDGEWLICWQVTAIRYCFKHT